MEFLIQSDDSGLKIESYIIKELLNQITIEDRFRTIGYSDISLKKLSKTKKADWKNAVPIGTIEFVTTWLRCFHGILKENPIEVPTSLRTDEFLKRKYSIVKAKDVPKEGRYFIKDASQLKSFSYSGDLDYFFSKLSFKDFDDTHLYQVSEIVNIFSEYRVYVLNGKIVAIINYDGNPLIMPDVNFIKKANGIYSLQQDYPKSYSMDIMVTDRGTSIIEVHNFTSIGLYTSVWGTDLLFAYKDGIEYLLQYNTEQSEFTNF